jgi:hypothetical protein
MKKQQNLWIALIFLLMPLLFRGMWFYHGFYFGNSDIQMPDYQSLSVVQPTISTAIPGYYADQNHKTTVLFDQAHNNQYTLVEIEPLRNQLILAGAEVVSFEPKNNLAEQLKKADAFVIITPTNDFSSVEIEAMEEFVHRGGRLLVIADPTRSFSEYDKEREESVMLTNEILQPFLLSFRNDYAYNLTHNEGNYRNIYVYPSSRNDLTKSISELVLYAAHSLDIYSEQVLSGEETTLSSLDDASNELPLAALDVSGNVLAIGDMTFLTSPYYQVSDNFQFVRNVADFLIDGNRNRNLYDFPNLFKGNIALKLASDITFDKELLAVITDVKNTYSQDDINVELQDEIDPEINSIVLGIYPPDNELNNEIIAFDIQFNELTPTSTPSPTEEITPDSTLAASEATENNNEKESAYGNKAEEYFQVPGFGKIPSKGFGFILLKQGENHNSLYLLADSQENAVALLGLVAGGSLKNCLVNDTIAICEQDAIEKSIPLSESEEDIGKDLIPDQASLQTTATPQPDLTPTATESPTPESGD